MENFKLPRTFFEELDWSMLMESIGQHLSHRVYSNSYSNGKVIKLPSIAIEEEDALVDSYSDIIDPNYRTWFIVQLRRIGKQKFVEAGDKARKYGRNPQKLFASLVRD